MYIYIIYIILLCFHYYILHTKNVIFGLEFALKNKIMYEVIKHIIISIIIVV